MKILLAFILGMVVATVGVTNLVSFADKQVENAKTVMRDNIK